VIPAPGVVIVSSVLNARHLPVARSKKTAIVRSFSRPNPILAMRHGLFGRSRQPFISTRAIKRAFVDDRLLKYKDRPQLGCPQPVVEKFIAEHRDLVEKEANFSHLTESEKDDILRLARELEERSRM
jgi:hypothetical protein